MSSLIGLLLLFHILSREDRGSVCPHLLPEATPIYGTVEEVKPALLVEQPDGNLLMYGVASSTQQGKIRFSKEKDGTWVQRQNVYKQIGSTPNKEAIEYNKRVEECRTKNGEF